MATRAGVSEYSTSPRAQRSSERSIRASWTTGYWGADASIRTSMSTRFATTQPTIPRASSPAPGSASTSASERSSTAVAVRWPKSASNTADSATRRPARSDRTRSGVSSVPFPARGAEPAVRSMRCSSSFRRACPAAAPARFAPISACLRRGRLLDTGAAHPTRASATSDVRRRKTPLDPGWPGDRRGTDRSCAHWPAQASIGGGMTVRAPRGRLRRSIVRSVGHDRLRRGGVRAPRALATPRRTS